MNAKGLSVLPLLFIKSTNLVNRQFTNYSNSKCILIQSIKINYSLPDFTIELFVVAFEFKSSKHFENN
jgi:hypothetical protein